MRTVEETYQAALTLSGGRRPAWADERAPSPDERRAIAGGGFWNGAMLLVAALAAAAALVVLWPRPSGPTPLITVAGTLGFTALITLPAWAYARRRGARTLADADAVLRPVAMASTHVGAGQSRHLVLVLVPLGGGEPVSMWVSSSTGPRWQERTAWALAVGNVEHRGHVALVLHDGEVVVGTRLRRIPAQLRAPGSGQA